MIPVCKNYFSSNCLLLSFLESTMSDILAVRKLRQSDLSDYVSVTKKSDKKVLNNYEDINGTKM